MLMVDFFTITWSNLNRRWLICMSMYCYVYVCNINLQIWETLQKLYCLYVVLFQVGAISKFAPTHTESHRYRPHINVKVLRKAQRKPGNPKTLTLKP